MLLHIALFDRSSEGNFMVMKPGSGEVIRSIQVIINHETMCKQFKNLTERQSFQFFFFSQLSCHIEISPLICINTMLLSRACIWKLRFWTIASPPTDHLQNLSHPGSVYSNICGSLKECFQREIGQAMCTGSPF